MKKELHKHIHIVLPSVREKRFKRFKTVWESLDEDTKEVIAGALFVLNHGPMGVLEAYHTTKAPFDNYKTEILSNLAEYTERN
jgi:hypothetical protein